MTPFSTQISLRCAAEAGEFRQMILRLCVIWFLLLSPAATWADYNASVVFSIEWLANESDMIVLVLNEDEKRVVLHKLKGTGEMPKNLITIQENDFGHYVRHPWTGTRNPWLKAGPSGQVSLLFLQQNKILQDVLLTRNAIDTGASVFSRFYGVTETGEMISSEPELIRAVKSALKEKRGDPIVRLPRAPFKKHSGAFAPPWFALESTGDMHIIITKFDEKWRDRLIAMAQEGTAVERIWALRQLSWNDDKKSVDALKRTAARLPEDVIPSSGGWNQEPLGAADVQRVAQKRLDWLRSDRTGYPEL